MEEIITDGYTQDKKTGRYFVYVKGELRAIAADQTEAAELYEKSRK